MVFVSYVWKPSKSAVNKGKEVAYQLGKRKRAVVEKEKGRGKCPCKVKKCNGWT